MSHFLYFHEKYGHSLWINIGLSDRHTRVLYFIFMKYVSWQIMQWTSLTPHPHPCIKFSIQLLTLQSATQGGGCSQDNEWSPKYAKVEGGGGESQSLLWLCFIERFPFLYRSNKRKAQVFASSSLSKISWNIIQAALTFLSMIISTKVTFGTVQIITLCISSSSWTMTQTCVQRTISHYHPLSQWLTSLHPPLALWAIPHKQQR